MNIACWLPIIIEPCENVPQSANKVADTEYDNDES